MSGKITPTLKAKLLLKVGKLLMALEIAKSEANKAAVIETKIGKSMFDYILSDLVEEFK